MLYMYIIKASDNSEAGNEPSQALQDQMRDYNKWISEAGIKIMAKGLYPSSEGIRISFPYENGERRVEKGPFKVSESLMAGFFIVEVSSPDEAIEWAMKIPDPQGFGQGQIEVRQIFD